MAGSSSADHLDCYRLIVDQDPNTIIVADRQGMIQTWNKAADDLLGYRPDEAIGRSLDIIIPEHLRSAHWDGFHQAVALGHAKRGRQALRTRATHKTGRKVYLGLAFAVLKDRRAMSLEQGRQLAH